MHIWLRQLVKTEFQNVTCNGCREISESYWRMDGVKTYINNSTQIGVCILNTRILLRRRRGTFSKRHSEINALKETRWSDDKSCNLYRVCNKNGYQFLFFASEHTQYAIGIDNSKSYRKATIHFSVTSAPQIDRATAEIDYFWQLLDINICNVSAGDYIPIANDFSIKFKSK